MAATRVIQRNVMEAALRAAKLPDQVEWLDTDSILHLRTAPIGAGGGGYNYRAQYVAFLVSMRDAPTHIWYRPLLIRLWHGEIGAPELFSKVRAAAELEAMKFGQDIEAGRAKRCLEGGLLEIEDSDTLGW